MPGESSAAEDNRIISRVLDGDINAFEHLIEKYKGYVFSIVGKHVRGDNCEEVAHQVFIRAYKSLSSFGGKSEFRHWLARITVRTCYDFWRDRYRRAEVPISELSEAQQSWVAGAVAEASNESYQRAADAAEAREVLDIALSRLSPEDRMVIELINIEEKSVKEAAELLGWSRTNVKVRAFRARRRLAKVLEDIVATGG
jgi:RNA polymerase sigma-70 factor (ECF subfamily)